VSPPSPCQGIPVPTNYKGTAFFCSCISIITTAVSDRLNTHFTFHNWHHGVNRFTPQLLSNGPYCVDRLKPLPPTMTTGSHPSSAIKVWIGSDLSPTVSNGPHLSFVLKRPHIKLWTGSRPSLHHSVNRFRSQLPCVRHHGVKRFTSQPRYEPIHISASTSETIRYGVNRFTSQLLLQRPHVTVWTDSHLSFCFRDHTLQYEPVHIPNSLWDITVWTGSHPSSATTVWTGSHPRFLSYQLPHAAHWPHKWY
jgi:hypothetical protein